MTEAYAVLIAGLFITLALSSIASSIRKLAQTLDQFHSKRMPGNSTVEALVNAIRELKPK